MRLAVDDEQQCTGMPLALAQRCGLALESCFLVSDSQQHSSFQSKRAS